MEADKPKANASAPTASAQAPSSPTASSPKASKEAPKPPPIPAKPKEWMGSPDGRLDERRERSYISRGALRELAYRLEDSQAERVEKTKEIKLKLQDISWIKGFYKDERAAFMKVHFEKEWQKIDEAREKRTAARVENAEKGLVVYEKKIERARKLKESYMRPNLTDMDRAQQEKNEVAKRWIKMAPLVTFIKCVQ